MKKFLILSNVLLLPLLLFSQVPSIQAQTSRTERIAFSAYRNGQWDIYSIAADGSDPRQLTNTPGEETDPMYAPDGSAIAFAARREGNWDVYTLDLTTGEEQRLTSSPHYEGAPSWSPDGTRLAYESFQNENLDIWVLDVAGEGPAINLTEDTPEGDFSPAWSPDGQFIAFASWRLPPAERRPGALTNNNLFLIDIDDGTVTQLTNTPQAEAWPAWHPDGDRLAFMVDDLGDQEVFMLDINEPPADGGPLTPVTWLGRTDGPAWSPAGDVVAGVFHRWDGDFVMVVDPQADHELPVTVTEQAMIQGRLTWHAEVIDFGGIVGSLAGDGVSTAYEETIAEEHAAFSGSTNMVRLNDIETGTPWLSDSVDDSFQTWRFQIRDEVGYDFLSQLSDATRDVGAYTETSQYASWHKSGRAIDTLFDYHLESGRLAHEIVREDYSGETYWRTYLRCEDQSGRCGRPLTVNPWNYSQRARVDIAPEQGGIERPNQSGYYVDFTAVGRTYGWDRISSFDDTEEYSWTWHFLAFEYWHYQKPLTANEAAPNTANWYQAMLDIYPPERLEQFFSWAKMREIGDDPYLIALKGVPLPLEQRIWWDLVAQ
ncbi:MAG: hypothetical protein AAF485_00520 [Chloroflexota bacterium]